MNADITNALEAIGADRIIWIDDCFNKTAAQLAKMLVNSLEVTTECEFPELQPVIESAEYSGGNLLSEVEQILVDQDDSRLEEMRRAFFEKEKESQEFESAELSDAVVRDVCQLLNISDSDQWTFDEADKNISELCVEGDSNVGYIVDLNESGGSNTRGLEILRTLNAGNSNGTAFILTHDATIESEGYREQDLLAQIGDDSNDGGIGFPVCIIAKQRLYESNTEGTGALTDALRVGLKRAGLRRSMHEVLAHATGVLQSAIGTATSKLLSIPPEQLEQHVYEKGFSEGVSELHVVERAITAHVGKEIRMFFGTNAQVQNSVSRLRRLRGIELNAVRSESNQHLLGFREAEIWESRDLLNQSLSPIACGDVFEFDNSEKFEGQGRFVVLGQPCEMSLRPNGQRSQDTAFFVQLKKVQNDLDSVNSKVISLPFILNGERWDCDTRNASVVNLAVLDLASFRNDGRVRFDENQEQPQYALAGQIAAYSARIKAPSEILASSEPSPEGSLINTELQMTFSTTGQFKKIHKPTLKDKNTGSRETGKIPRRLIWGVRRCGRIRMPYAAAFLEQYTSVLSRQAYEVDFMLPPT